MVLGNKEEAYLNFNEAIESIESLYQKGISQSSIDYMKETLKILAEEINLVKLKKVDECNDLREKRAVNLAVNAINNENERVSVETIAEEFKNLNEIKEQIAFLQEKYPNSYELYDGLCYTLTQSFEVSRIIESGTFVLNTKSTKIQITSMLISLIPIAGPTLSKGLESTWSFTQDEKIRKSSNFISKLASSLIEFDSIVIKNAVFEAIKELIPKLEDFDQKQTVFKKPMNNFPSWVLKFLKSANLKIEDIERILYGERFETELQKIGNRVGTLILSNYIGNGLIYNGKSF